MSLIQLSSPLSNPPTPLSDTLDGTPSWSLAMESTLQTANKSNIHFLLPGREFSWHFTKGPSLAKQLACNITALIYKLRDSWHWLFSRVWQPAALTFSRAWHVFLVLLGSLCYLVIGSRSACCHLVNLDINTLG